MGRYDNLVTGKRAKLPGVIGDLELPPLEPPKKPRNRTDLRHKFLEAWIMGGFAGKEAAEEEYRFHPTRRWRFDIAFPVSRVAVELDGGIWVKGRHSRGSGVVGDIEKLNAATLLGWQVLRFTADDLRKRPVQICEQVRRLLAVTAAAAPTLEETT
jgi:hypothetical protein